MENLLLPSKIEFIAGETPNHAAFVVMPCYHGYGTTIGNALRRVLLASLPGAAVEAFKIRGIQHEFTTVEGVKEDVVEIMLNLKQLIVKVYSDEPVTLTLTKKGSGVVTAKDFEKNSSVEIFNKDLAICNLTSAKPFEMDVIVGRGRGFKTTEEKNRGNYDLGTIVVDSIYSPIKDVGYHVEYTRVGDITNYEKLTLTIETNGTMSPKDAIFQSTQILMNHFSIILDESQKGLTEEKIVSVEESQVGEGEADIKPKKKTAKKKTK
ncbi:MAG: DNA-directed RNA polymerase subunit alpha [Candidatus Magasanikbacteria bacterium]|nr:DNA-directed RNA polymerase subunit alpha [Candidatus Magasanikbacteria bacterium]